MSSKRFTDEQIFQQFEEKRHLFPMGQEEWDKNGLHHPMFIRSRFKMSGNDFLKWRGLPVKQDRKKNEKLDSLPLQIPNIESKPILEILPKKEIEDIEIIKKRIIELFHDRQYLFSPTPLPKEENEKHGLPSYKYVEKIFEMKYESFLIMIGCSKGEVGSIRYIVASFEEKKQKFPGLQIRRYRDEGLISPDEIKNRFGLDISSFLSIVFDESYSRDDKISQLQYHQNKSSNYTVNNQTNNVKNIEKEEMIKIELHISKSSLEEMIKQIVEITLENLKVKI